MKLPARSIPLILLLAVPAAALQQATRGPKPPEAAPAPEVKVEGYRIVVEKLVQNQNLALEFPDPADRREGVSRMTGRQLVYVHLAVHPPNPKLIPNLDGLDGRIVAFSGNSPVTFRPYPADDANPLTTGVWRTMLMAQDVDLSVSRLDRLQGELVVYPSAKQVKLEFPVPSDIPVTREAEGLRVVMRPMKPRGEILTVALEMSWPAEVSVARASPEAPGGIAVVTKAGNTILPTGSGNSPGESRGRRVSRIHTVTFTEFKEAQATLRVQTLVRGGPARKLAFTLPNLPLPDTLGLEATLDDEEGAEPFQEGHPLYARGGGALVLTVRPAPSAAGRFTVGLSRREGAQFGPWRWVELPLDREGRATLPHLKPGTYRLARAWWDTLEGTRVRAAPVEAVVTAGQTFAVPPLELGGRP
jgi:hypothetical protein